MTKESQKNGNETKSDIFPWDIFKSDVTSFLNKKMLKYFIDFQNMSYG